jgi:hypothetical protein
MKTHFVKLLIPGFIIVTVFALTAARTLPNKDCSKASKHATEAQRHFKDAKNTKNIKDLHNSAKKGMDAATDAEIAAEKSICDCDAAEQAAQNAYNHGKNAYKTDEVELAKQYVSKAYESAVEISTAINTCNNK